MITGSPVSEPPRALASSFLARRPTQRGLFSLQLRTVCAFSLHGRCRQDAGLSLEGRHFVVDATGNQVRLEADESALGVLLPQSRQTHGNSGKICHFSNIRISCPLLEVVFQRFSVCFWKSCVCMRGGNWSHTWPPAQSHLAIFPGWGLLPHSFSSWYAMQIVVE